MGSSEEHRVQRDGARSEEQEHAADDGEVDGVLGARRVVGDQVSGPAMTDDPGHQHRKDQYHAGGPSHEAEREESKEKSLHYKLASLEARLNLTSERLDRTLELTKQSDQKIDELIRSGREDREALKAQLDGISEALAKSA